MNSIVDLNSANEVLPVINTNTVVQKLLFPDTSINSEEGLYYHSPPTSGANLRRKCYYMESGDVLHFDSYFNAFPLYAYDLDSRHTLSLRLRGVGDCTIFAYKAFLGKSWELFQRTNVSFGADEEVLIPLKSGEHEKCLIYFSVVAETMVELSEADYLISGPQRNQASITAVITTFQRDEAVQSTARRLQDYVSQNKDLESNFNLLVIDNGGDTDTIPFDRGRVIKKQKLWRCRWIYAWSTGSKRQ